MRKSVFAVVVSAILTGGGVAAHHSYGAYHLDRTVEIEGEIEAFNWAAPHSFLKVRAAGTLYALEWAAPNGLTRQGVQRDTLKVGDRIIITGNPHREIAGNGIVRLRSIRRPSDGWNWPTRGGW